MKNNNKMRPLNIDIAQILEKLNPKFIESLPISPEELLRYTKRRINPEISDNIPEDLAKKMLEYRLSDEDYFITFLKIIKHLFSDKIPEKTNPEAKILISQTGSGKTNLRKLLLEENNNCIVIDSDLYKKFRPDAESIRREDPTHFGALTGIDCYDHANNFINLATSKGYNILIECAPTRKEGIVGVNLEDLDEKGYRTHSHVLAVGDLVSALAIHYRYEIDLQMKLKGAKLTDLKRHDESYDSTISVIRRLNAPNIRVYRRGKKEESQVPQIIKENEESTEEIVDSLNKERKKSNTEYKENGFDEDYRTISNFMQKRQAPEEEKRQLQIIKERGDKFEEQSRLH